MQTEDGRTTSGSDAPHCPKDEGPGHGRSGSAAPDHGRSGSAAPDYGRSGSAAPGHGRSGSAAPGHGRSGSAAPGHGLVMGYDRLDEFDVSACRARFEHAGYLPLPGLLTDSALSGLRAEVARLQREAKRRDFRMECMGGTPRHMTTLGGIEIARTAPAISALYRDPQLIATLGSLVGLTLELAADPVERHVLNMLHRSGDTHGLHTDDYPLALVLFLESPTCEAGCGHLEFFDVCQAGHSSVKSHQAGDAYLLRADKFPHRVRPIHDGCVRTVLNFAYGADSIPVGRTASASILYS